MILCELGGHIFKLLIRRQFNRISYYYIRLALISYLLIIHKSDMLFQQRDKYLKDEILNPYGKFLRKKQ